MIKFSKDGKFVTADNDEAVDEAAEFIVLADETLVGWLKWNEDAPPDRVMGLLYGGFTVPPRGELGDMDESKWELGLDAKPADPWKHQNYLVLQRTDTDELATFVTSSKTGRRACANLLRHYNRMKHTYPDAYPVVRLKPSGFQHRDDRVGWVPTPAFAVVGRAPRGAAAKPDTTPGGDMEDEIPF